MGVKPFSGCVHLEHAHLVNPGPPICVGVHQSRQGQSESFDCTPLLVNPCSSCEGNRCLYGLQVGACGISEPMFILWRQSMSVWTSSGSMGD